MIEMSESYMRKHGMKSIKWISYQQDSKPLLVIDDFDGHSYSYHTTDFDIEAKIKQHIKSYSVFYKRKEKLQKLNEIH